MDELHVRLRGGKAYVYVVEDDCRSIIALELTWRRNKEATARVLRKAKVEAGFTPDIIVSDGAPAYPPAIEEAIPGAKHIIAQFKGTPVGHDVFASVDDIQRAPNKQTANYIGLI